MIDAATKGDELVCQELVELVTDYLAGVLSPERRAQLEAHMAVCPPCREYVEQIQRTVWAIGSARAGPLDSLDQPGRARLIALFRGWRDQPTG